MYFSNTESELIDSSRNVHFSPSRCDDPDEQSDWWCESGVKKTMWSDGATTITIQEQREWCFKE